MIDYSAVKSPFSDDLACGPDLELEGDDVFLNYLAAAEGRLPSSFFGFSRDSIDIKGELQAISGLLERTRDIRLLTLAAKFSILSGDLVGFADAIEAISYLLTQHWNDLHPRGIDGDFTLRGVQIESLDDMPSTALPLQYAPLVRHHRHGTICLRSHLIALGEVQPREGETVLDAAAVRDALLTSEDLDELKSRYDAVCRVEEALKIIAERYAEETGYSGSLAFERIPLIINKIRQLIEGPLRERDPAAVEARSDATAPGAGEDRPGTPDGLPGAPPHAAAVIRLEDRDAAVQALKAAERHFADREPSNPCILLIRQALQLVGKSFIEAMHLLVPTRMESATIQLGASRSLAIPITQLDSFAATDGDAGDAGEVPDGGPADGEQKTFSADSRSDAVNLIAAAERYFVEFEPSSPVPLLLAGARSYVNRDF
ncbi:MAG TPA: type VI secretion system ImpA family N-terminal domain-containing protein, partial [Aestuariivirgaceae bacterium]|nr:type VI secretion system ImpA family N-terminal domain-containing protein [Aestuariivirgaceae bacterium]